MRYLSLFGKAFLVVVGLGVGGTGVWLAAQQSPLAHVMTLSPLPENFDYRQYARDAPFLLVSDANCHYCLAAKEFLATAGVRVAIIEAPEQLALQQRVLANLGVKGVPILLTESGYLSGFDARLWQSLVAGAD